MRPLLALLACATHVLADTVVREELAKEEARRSELEAHLSQAAAASTALKQRLAALHEQVGKFNHPDSTPDAEKAAEKKAPATDGVSELAAAADYDDDDEDDEEPAAAGPQNIVAVQVHVGNKNFPAGGDGGNAVYSADTAHLTDSSNSSKNTTTHTHHHWGKDAEKMMTDMSKESTKKKLIPSSQEAADLDRDGDDDDHDDDFDHPDHGTPASPSGSQDEGARSRPSPRDENTKPPMPVVPETRVPASNTGNPHDEEELGDDEVDDEREVEDQRLEEKADEEIEDEEEEEEHGGPSAPAAMGAPPKQPVPASPLANAAVKPEPVPALPPANAAAKPPTQPTN